ncbi:hypothetical protein [Oricola indica]|jgi:hypothetical protein|uniref:hypothetical protein n=1 Tax=Oricola indica TaxID=2872591 RepID=UPI001CC08EF6|nr:hypothetical protein [Oricola indica]
MQRTVNVQTNQKVSTQDLNNFGAFPRESFDNTVADMGGFTAPRYVGFQVEATGASEVRVGTGRLYKPGGAVYGYDDEGGATIDLLDYLPAVAKRIATVIVYGNTINTDIEPRTFLLDAETGQTEGREVSVENRRQAYIDKVLGQENATPQEPAISSDYCAVAHVVLTPAGIESITQITANQLRSLRKNYEEIDGINKRLASVGPQIDTLKTDVSALAIAVRSKAEFVFVKDMARDLARVKEEVGLPDDYVAYGADRFLDTDESDTDHPDFDCVVEEGIRFPYAAEATQSIALLNAIEPRVAVNDNMALPAFTSATRLSVVGKDGEHALTSTTIETVELVKRTESRSRRVYYGAERVCTNSSWWRTGRYDVAKGIFIRDGETFEVENTTGRIEQDGLTHWVRVRRYVEETYNEVYWDRLVETEEVAGAIVGQTFLNSQDGWLTGLNLYFTKKADAGDVRVLITETVNGQPALDKVLMKKTITPANISIWPSKTAISLKPTFLAKGKRYAMVIISSGAHFVATVANNKFAQGTIFYSTDGSFTQGDLYTDLAFETQFAVFAAPIVDVQLEALELTGGIDAIDILADMSMPEGTRIEFSLKIGNIWKTLDDTGDVNILSTRPSLAQFRMRFIGTTDVMPAIGLGADRTRVHLSRPDDAFVHVSEERAMPSNVDTVEVTLKLENWDDGDHTATITVLTGGAFDTVETADAVVDVADPDDPAAVIRTATFGLAGATDSYKIKVAGATTDDTKCFHVAERTDLGYLAA